MSPFDLTGMVAIVTGSSRGIGLASARELAEHGAKIVISSRKQDACDTVAAELNATYGDGTASSAQAEKTVAKIHGLADAAWGFAVKAGA